MIPGPTLLPASNRSLACLFFFLFRVKLLAKVVIDLCFDRLSHLLVVEVFAQIPGPPDRVEAFDVESDEIFHDVGEDAGVHAEGAAAHAVADGVEAGFF